MATYTQINSWTIPALVLDFNHVTFINKADQVVGRVLDVPCKNDNVYDNEDMWAIPIKDSGILTGFDFELQAGDYLAQPTFDSIQCFRLRDKNMNEWIIASTKNEFFTACNTCCNGTPTAMPNLNGLDDRIAPCQILDIVNGSGYPYMVYSVPSLDDGALYYAYGSYDNVALPSLIETGYTTVAALVGDMNAYWTNFVWTYDGVITIKGTATSKNLLNHSLCVNIISLLGSA